MVELTLECPDWRKRKRGKPRINPAKVNDIYRLRGEGWSYFAIAVHLDLSSMTVWRYLNKKEYIEWARKFGVEPS